MLAYTNGDATGRIGWDTTHVVDYDAGDIIGIQTMGGPRSGGLPVQAVVYVTPKGAAVGDHDGVMLFGPNATDLFGAPPTGDFCGFVQSGDNNARGCLLISAPTFGPVMPFEGIFSGLSLAVDQFTTYPRIMEMAPYNATSGVTGGKVTLGPSQLSSIARCGSNCSFSDGDLPAIKIVTGDTVDSLYYGGVLETSGGQMLFSSTKNLSALTNTILASPGVEPSTISQGATVPAPAILERLHLNLDKTPSQPVAAQTCHTSDPESTWICGDPACTITAPATSCSDLTHRLGLAPRDFYRWQITVPNPAVGVTPVAISISAKLTDNGPTATPTNTAMPTFTPINMPTATGTPTLSATPTIPPPTNGATPAITATVLPTPPTAGTPTVTATPTPSATPTATPSPTPTEFE